MENGNSSPLNPTQAAELEALAALSDDQIDLRDMPEQLDWNGARRGMFFRPKGNGTPARKRSPSDGV